MIYYDKNGIAVNYNCAMNGFNKGTQGSIFRLTDDNSVCLKQYFDTNNNRSIFDDCGSKFTGEMFDYFSIEFKFVSYMIYCMMKKIMLLLIQ